MLQANRISGPLHLPFSHCSKKGSEEDTALQLHLCDPFRTSPIRSSWYSDSIPFEQCRSCSWLKRYRAFRQTFGSPIWSCPRNSHDTRISRLRDAFESTLPRCCASVSTICRPFRRPSCQPRCWLFFIEHFVHRFSSRVQPRWKHVRPVQPGQCSHETSRCRDKVRQRRHRACEEECKVRKEL